jgi:hypothetical protein
MESQAFAPGNVKDCQPPRASPIRMEVLESLKKGDFMFSKGFEVWDFQ